jgi:hypothetical protein
VRLRKCAFALSTINRIGTGASWNAHVLDRFARADLHPASIGLRGLGRRHHRRPRGSRISSATRAPGTRCTGDCLRLSLGSHLLRDLWSGHRNDRGIHSELDRRQPIVDRERAMGALASSVAVGPYRGTGRQGGQLSVADRLAQHQYQCRPGLSHGVDRRRCGLNVRFRIVRRATAFPGTAVPTGDPDRLPCA